MEEKIIDKATQKLKLDQLVIQQGRASQAKRETSKDELLAMIQHGANDIFNNSGSTITNDDIEEILRRSEQKTAELDQKYKDMGLDELQKFTMGGDSLYKWEGEDFSTKKRKAGRVNLNWIQPAKRERKGMFFEMECLL